MEDDKKMQRQQFLLGLFGGIAIVAVIALIILGIAFIKASGSNGTDKITNQNPGAGQTEDQTTGQGPATINPTAPGVSTFSEKKDAVVCKEDGKPVVYLFSTTWCPHCEWVKDTFDKIASEYVKAGKIKAYHWEIDTSDDTLTTAAETKVPDKDMAVYQEFNPQGSIPTFVIGCKYFRIGNGYEAQQDLTAEAKELKAAIDAIIK